MTSRTPVSDIVELYTAMSYDESQDVCTAAMNWLVGKDPLKCFHSGKLELIAESGKYKTQTLQDPCTGDYLVSLVVPIPEDVKSVLTSSFHGQESWNDIDQHSKGKLISHIAKALEEQKDVVAQVEALTFGTSFSEIKREVSRSISYFKYYASWPHLMKKNNGDAEKGAVIISLLKPAPLFAIASAVASALAAGHAVLINPPFESPLSSFLLAELCSNAGLPAGVVNVIPGPFDVDKELCKENVHQMVVWGSGPSCRNVCTAAANYSWPIIPFYYGKSISIIFDSSDQSSAIDILLKNISFSYQQMPWSVRTILVEESSFSTFADMLKRKFHSCKVGNYRDHAIDIGLPKKCDADTSAFLKDVLRHLQQRGIEIFQIPAADSLFFTPTLIIGTDAETNSIVKDYDILPFVSVIPFRRPSEAIGIANKSQFGVAASVWTTCLSLSLYMASNLEVGTVWINDHGVVDPSVSFSNRKQGFGCIGGQKGLQQFHSFPLNEQVDLSKGDTKQDLVELQGQKEYLPHYGGTFKETTSKTNISVTSATRDIFLVSICDRNDVKKAIDAARSAQPQWWKLGSSARAGFLLSVAEKFQEASKGFLKFFRSTAPENEKELENCVNNLYTWASRSSMVTSRNSNPLPNILVQHLQGPLGVIGIIVDDSTELDSVVLTVVSAISHGNSVVVIPSSKNPVPALEFCSFLAYLKLPAGLVNVIPGFKCAMYSEVVYHKDVHAVWYSGNNRSSWSTLCSMTNKVMKFLWKCPDTSVDWETTEIEYAASHTKTVWLPNENASC